MGCMLEGILLGSTGPASTITSWLGGEEELRIPGDLGVGALVGAGAAAAGAAPGRGRGLDGCIIIGGCMGGCCGATGARGGTIGGSLKAPTGDRRDWGVSIAGAATRGGSGTSEGRGGGADWVGETA